MKLLLVIADGKPGGGTTFILSLLQALSSQHQCYLISEAESYLLHVAQPYCHASLGLDFFNMRIAKHNTNKMHAWIASVQPDVVHVNGSRALWLLSHCLCPVIYTVHGYHHQQQGWLKALVGRWLERRATCKVTEQVFVSQQDQQLARKCKLTQVPVLNQHVVPNGIDLNNVPEKSGRVGKVVGFLGRFEEPKNPLFAIAVMRHLAPKGYQLLMVGAGSLYQQSQQAIQGYHLTESVILLGECTQKEALHALCKMDVLLMPSLWEAQGISAIEAQAAGVPVVASTQGGLPEVVQDGVTGTLVEGWAVQDYADAIAAILSSSEHYQQMSKAAKAWAHQFDLSGMVLRYQALYERCVHDSSQ